MSKYRKIDVRIWNDAKFSTMSDNGKLAFLFVLTHPHMTSLGAMRATIPGMAAELGWKPEAFREAFREALTKGLAKHDEKASFVWLPNFLKYNAPESPNVVKSWEKSLELIPECDMYFELLQQVKAFTEALPKGFVEALPEDFRKSMPNPEPEQEQEPEQEEKKKRASLSIENIIIPDALDFPEFIQAWGDWIRHRIEIRHPLKPTQAEKQLKHFAQWGVVRSIAAIEHTITMGWQGIREPDARAEKKPERKSRVATPEELANWNPNARAEDFEYDR